MVTACCVADAQKIIRLEEALINFFQTNRDRDDADIILAPDCAEDLVLLSDH